MTTTTQTLPAHVLAEVQRVLDAEARRIANENRATAANRGAIQKLTTGTGQHADYSE